MQRLITLTKTESDRWRENSSKLKLLLIDFVVRTAQLEMDDIYDVSATYASNGAAICRKLQGSTFEFATNRC